MGVFYLRVRLAGGEVAPLHPWVGEGAKSAIWADSAHVNRTLPISQHSEVIQSSFGGSEVGAAFQCFFAKK